jgi:protocatechuate 3,4-dioxygenase beta subunit
MAKLASSQPIEALEMANTRINRRQAIMTVAVGATGGTLLTRSAFAQQASGSAAHLLAGADVCVITPEVTEGPYYFDPALERADITEDLPGVPISVQLQVVDQSCAPIEGARVDIWHANADGIYSGYANQPGGLDTTGETFMRGTLFTDESGLVTFRSVYPGWYRGRTTHIHFKVFLDTANVLTGQLFFPDALSEFIYLNAEPYNARTELRDTLNANDSIATQATRASFAYVKELADAYHVAMIIGVDPNAQSSGFELPGSGDRPPGPPPEGMGGPPPDGVGGPPPGGAEVDRALLVPGSS